MDVKYWKNLPWVDEDFEETQTVTFSSSQPSNEIDVQTLTYSIEPSSVTFATMLFEPSSGSVSFQAIADGNGSQAFTITVNDGEAENNTATTSFTVMVTAINDDPVINNSMSDFTKDEDFDTVTVSLVDAFDDVDGDALTLSVENGNDAIDVSIDGTDLIVTALADASGIGELTISATDGSVSISQAFSIEILPVNDAPVMETIADQETEPNVDIASLPLVFSDIDNTVDQMVITMTSDNAALFPEGSMMMNEDKTAMTLSPVADVSGSAQITVIVSDGFLEVGATFTVSVADILATADNTPSIHLYPNPVMDKLQIEVPSTDGFQVEVIDMEGKLIRSAIYREQQGTMDVAPLKRGVYLIRINSNKNVITQRLVKN